MGRRGPVPMPTEMLKLRGSWRANANPDEPKPEPINQPPEAPEWFGPDAKACWDDLLRILTARRMISQLDLRLLTRYCDAWQKWLEATKSVREHGDSYAIKGKDGRVKAFQPMPAAVAYRSLSEMLIKMERELGLSPSARARLRTEASAHPPGEVFRSYPKFWRPPEMEGRQGAIQINQSGTS